MGDRWEDARRIESWAGETRVNLIRLAAIIAFYGNHLVQVYLLKDDQAVTGSFHAAVTTVIMAWALEVLALGAAGLLAGQAVRQARRLVEGYFVAADETAES